MVILDGRQLTVEKLIKIACRQEKVRIKESQWPKIRRSHRFVEQHAANKEPMYGINTGFGALAQVRIGLDKVKILQHNILLSHNAGVGKTFSPEFVRAALALRINALIKGNSGVSSRLIEQLVTILNKNIVPVVPQKGSVGASGDLAPMAAIGLLIIGKGEVFYRGKRMPAQRALRLAKIRTMKLSVRNCSPWNAISRGKQ